MTAPSSIVAALARMLGLLDRAPNDRELLKAAMKAGVHVHVLCQKFSQVDRNDVDWLNEFCSPYIISKMRDPRPATAEEINKKFR